MPICYKCKVDLDLDKFSKNRTKKSGYNRTCKTCQKKYKDKHYESNKSEYISRHRKRKAKLRKIIQEYKSNRCCKYCNENDQRCLDFHHRDSNEKVKTISIAITCGWSLERIFQEIEKCDLVCSNCHRKIHN